MPPVPGRRYRRHRLTPHREIHCIVNLMERKAWPRGAPGTTDRLTTIPSAADWDDPETEEEALRDMSLAFIEYGATDLSMARILVHMCERFDASDCRQSSAISPTTVLGQNMRYVEDS
jgi:hypothetical protein